MCLCDSQSLSQKDEHAHLVLRVPQLWGCHEGLFDGTPLVSDS